MNNQLTVNPSIEVEEYASYIEIEEQVIESSSSAFIGANTIEVNLQEIQGQHIIPVFSKDNEPLISHGDFIQTTYDVINHCFKGEDILSPSIRVSHPIKGRTPEARYKPANQLEDHERTIYYERAMFVFEIPSIQRNIDGQTLSLTIGGVKCYGDDKLNNKKGSSEHFKIFIGFSVKVCSNLCVWSDGAQVKLVVRSQGELMDAIMNMISVYNPEQHLKAMQRLTEHNLTEAQFAQVLGRARLYNYLPNEVKKEIPPLLFTDTQLGSVAKDYFQDNSFCRNDNGDINLWRMYNLFTSANKSSYVDSFLERNINAFDFTHQLQTGLAGGGTNWYLN
ncbi:DUF3871 family protein [Aquirufa antheringensis]|uniref:DUF3871 family protein n=1 Tax=Aquirufa antheringensis TaxID=2516559 RepID=UPI0010328043|nr:DUF3871 family protein [Aquirufa antheringensis]MCZ2476530.1 DUF3871 family protein [Aquirufa antheringensis]TBH70165.1 DUF3871 family protein [Aquirufa antheringensis]